MVCAGIFEGGKTVEIDGVRFGSMREIAEHFKINESTLLTRLNSGWDIDRALREPIRKPTMIKVEGEFITMNKAMRVLVCSEWKLRNMMKAGEIEFRRELRH